MDLDIYLLGWNMDRLMRLRRSLINSEADENGVYLGQHSVLRYIRENPGCSQQELAEALSQTPAAVALSTKRLLELEFITKEKDPKNHRKYRLFITEKGEENRQKMLEVIRRYTDRIFDGFSGEELEQLEEYTHRMYLNLKPYKEAVSDNGDRK